MNPVAQTAQWMAAIRARESTRPDRLFEDPLAAALAGGDWQTMLARMGDDNPYVPIRTRFFDDFLLAATAAPDLRQVVLPGAGMDARAFRLPWPAGTRLYELDQPELLALKESILAEAGAQATCARTPLGLNLAEPWGARLVAAGFDPAAPSVWLIEGVLPYLTPAAVTDLLAEVRTQAAAGSRLAADLPNRAMLHSRWTEASMAVLAARGSPWRFSADEPRNLFARHGWAATVTQPGEAGADFGRWTFPVLPRDVPGVPRYFLIDARRV